MVLRRDAAGVLAVGQPAHAALCGQFARAWGNARFAPVRPLDDVALGAEQHDVGWARHDLAPELHPETGLPRDFMQTPLAASIGLWRTGPPSLQSQSRWAALLAAMHGRRLYARIDLTARPAVEARAIAALLAELGDHERRLTASLRADPATAGLAGAAAIARNSDLVWAWDVLSLALLLDWAPRTLRGVPTTAGGVDIELRDVTARGGRPTCSLSPWPFAEPDAVVVRTEGRRLPGPCATQDELDAAFAAAPWETIAFTLVPGAPD